MIAMTMAGQSVGMPAAARSPTLPDWKSTSSSLLLASIADAGEARGNPCEVNSSAE